MLENGTLIMLLLFMVKHFIWDFTPLQTPYMWMNKGKYGHPGGILHAALHVVASFPILFFYSTHIARYFPSAPWMNTGWLLVFSLIFEFLSHYHMDWAKVKIGKATGWRPDNSPHFWTLLGVDQLVHFLTYWIITYVWFIL